MLVVGVILWTQKDYRLIYAGQEPILVGVAEKKTELIQGLSNRERLSPGHGMLFILEDESMGCMWMNEMKFSIDVYWYTNSGELINHYSNLTPETFPTVFCPTSAASYMLEVNTGELEELPLKLSL